MCSEKKVNDMKLLLITVVQCLNDHNIAYYLDCGTLLGCIREGGIMKHDTDIDVTIHLSSWEDLQKISFKRYDLEVMRVMDNGHYLISVQRENSEMYCDIYANPAFPNLIDKKMYDHVYKIPIEPELYLTQLYGDWTVPSDKHADWPTFFYGDLITGNYAQYWNPKYKIIQRPPRIWSFLK